MDKEHKLASKHSEIIEWFDITQSAQRDVRLECLADRRFYSITGAQYEGPLEEAFQNKPKIEVNKIRGAVKRVKSEYRNNRIDVEFVSKDGSDSDKLADACNDAYRADEQDSGAEEAFDNAFEDALGGGFGAWRLRTDYEDQDDDENDYQKVCIEPIFDADSSAFFDLDAKRQDKADSKRAILLTAMTPQAYKAEYGRDPASISKEVSQSEFDWFSPDVIFIGEYYEIEKKKETVHIYTDLSGEEERYTDSELEADPELLQTLIATGSRETGTKKVTRQRVRKYILDGASILEDCGYIAGKHIPIVPVYGERWYIDGVERCMGMVRLAKDSQRLKNTQLSKLLEISLMSGVEKPIVHPEQMAGHQIMWSEGNIKDYPYMLLNKLLGPDGQEMPGGPVDYTRVPTIPPALAALLQITESDMQDVLGNQQAGEEVVSNISGKAVEMIQTRLDMQAFIYMSNMAKAVKRSGEIWLSMKREIAVEKGRKLKGISKQGVPRSIELLRPTINEDGAIEYENDFSRANFDIAVTVGPSSSSKRAATVRALTGMLTLTQDPETASVLSAMTMLNMEGEGISEVRDYFRNKMVRMGVIKPSEEEARELQAEAQNQQPDPNALYLQAAAKEAEAKSKQAEANAVLTMAKTEETKAKTIETLAGIEQSQRESFVQAAQALTQAT